MGCVTSLLGSSSDSQEPSSLSTISSQARAGNLPSPTITTTTTTTTTITTTKVPISTSNPNVRFGKCDHCSSPYISYNWCRNCAFPGKTKWTTGNELLDEFINYTQEISPDYKTYLEWIPFEQFIDIKEIGKGGFSTVFEAIWAEGPKRNFDPLNKQWCRIGNTKVALKLLHDSQQITEDFLNNMKKYYQCKNRENLVEYFGISQDPKTKEYILVTHFANKLDLRTFIFTKYYNNNNNNNNNNDETLTWNEKINILKSIAEILKSMHNEKSPQGEKLFHGNLHPGNVLKNINSESKEESILIGDLGYWIPSNYLKKNSQKYLQPSSSSSNNNNYLLYGILPYVAPEILRGDKKSQASDIYNFGMIMWELSTLSLPYFDRAHNLELALEICEGVRPNPLPTTPEFYFDLMERCWEDDPSLRPNAIEIIRILDMNQLYLKYSEQTMRMVENQEHYSTKNRLSMISEKFTKKVKSNDKSVVGVGGLRGAMKKKFRSKKENLFTTNIHPEAYYTSRILEFSFDRLSIYSNSNNSFMAGNTSTSEDFGEETGQSSLAISEMGLDDAIEDFIIISKDSKGKEKALT